MPLVFSITVANCSILFWRSISLVDIIPPLAAAFKTAIAPSVLSPSPNPPWDSTVTTFAFMLAFLTASFISSPIIMLTQVPTTPTRSGENISSTLRSVSLSFSDAPNMKSFSDMAVVTTLTPSFSKRRPVLKQQPCGP